MKKEKQELIWHYCTAETFLNIITNQTIRFSSISHSNDFMELNYGIKLLEDMLDYNMYDSNFMDFIDSQVLPYINSSAYLGVCFSDKQDLLSQWRGYSSNGAGYSIGFKRESLEKIFINFPHEKVLYNEVRQKERIAAILEDLNIYFTEDGENNRHLQAPKLISELAICIASFKSKAFKEEAEHRILMELKKFSYLSSGTKLVLKSGQYDESRRKIVSFRLVGNTPVPFYDHSLKKNDTPFPIAKVIVGPKNLSTKKDIETFLTSNGITGVKVKKSKASYR